MVLFVYSPVLSLPHWNNAQKYDSGYAAYSKSFINTSIENGLVCNRPHLPATLQLILYIDLGRQQIHRYMTGSQILFHLIYKV